MSNERFANETEISGIVQNVNNNTTSLNIALNNPGILKQLLMLMCPGSLFSFMLVHKAAKNMLSDSHGMVLNSMLYFTNIEPEGDKQAFERMKKIAIHLVGAYEEIYPMKPEQMLWILNAKRCQFCNTAETVEFPEFLTL